MTALTPINLVVNWKSTCRSPARPSAPPLHCNGEEHDHVLSGFPDCIKSFLVSHHLDSRCTAGSRGFVGVERRSYCMTDEGTDARRRSFRPLPRKLLTNASEQSLPTPIHPTASSSAACLHFCNALSHFPSGDSAATKFTPAISARSEEDPKARR